MSVFAKAEALTKLAQIQGNMTAAVQAANQLESTCGRVNGLWQDWKAANADDQDTLDAAQAEFAAMSGAAWTNARSSIINAMDILAGGVGLTRNELLDSLKTAE